MGGPVTRILNLETHDLRFPTSVFLDGSDAMNPDPDYSAAYVILSTDHPEGLAGHGFTFTIGRGNEICVKAIEAFRPFIVGRSLEEIIANMGGFWRGLAGDSQLRWLGPEKGVIHLALAAVLNAVWDLWAKSVGKPVWKLVADLTPEQFVSLIDFRHLEDALTRAEALDILHTQAAGKPAREARLRAEGYPAYTTSVGWLGYDDDKLRRLCREALTQGWQYFKIKVGRDLADDVRRCSIIRQEIGYDRKLMMDANQWWDVDQAIDHMKALARFKPLWIEEPTSPDDVLGHAAIARAVNPLGIGVATGEHCQNRILFKQLMQSGGLQFCQIDACRLGGVNEVLAVYLLAKKFNIPVCPHAGGVGLCELVQHLSIWDYISCGASLENRVIEYVDHLHEHFVSPVRIKNGRYLPPTDPGYSATIKPTSLADYDFTTGRIWKSAPS